MPDTWYLRTPCKPDADTNNSPTLRTTGVDTVCSTTDYNAFERFLMRTWLCCSKVRTTLHPNLLTERPLLKVIKCQKIRTEAEYRPVIITEYQPRRHPGRNKWPWRRLDSFWFLILSGKNPYLSLTLRLQCTLSDRLRTSWTSRHGRQFFMGGNPETRS